MVQAAIEVDFPWERLTGEPLIYASMGTLMNGLAEVYRTITAATAKHKGFQLVLSIGDQLKKGQASTRIVFISA
jgi:UDP:flavonoid glycosyltransferase YjiC (YdhE family)